MHLALINIARARFRLTDPQMADFFNNIARINAVADRSPGFVWRLVESTEQTPQSITVFKDPKLIINMAVWTSVEALEDYTYRTVHKHIMHRRNEWFACLDQPHMALWWIEPGTIPTVEEGKRRLDLLQAEGPTNEAFTFKSAFAPPDVAH